MRPPLYRRLADLFALLLAIGLCSFAVIKTFQADTALSAFVIGVLGSVLIATTLRAAQAMLRDWTTRTEAQ